MKVSNYGSFRVRETTNSVKKIYKQKNIKISLRKVRSK